MLYVRDDGAFDKAVTSLQVRLWYAVIVALSGLGNNGLCRWFPSDSREHRQKHGAFAGAESGYWDQIRKGRCLPLRTTRGCRLVDRVEVAFPGTKRWIVSPLWRLLRTAPVTSQYLFEVFSGLPDDIRELLLVEPGVASLFFRRPASENLYKSLERIASRPLEDEARSFARLMGCTVAVLALVREAELRQNQPQHYGGRLAWERMVRRLIVFAGATPLVDELMQLGKARFRGTVYSPDGEGEMVMSCDQ